MYTETKAKRSSRGDERPKKDVDMNEIPESKKVSLVQSRKRSDDVEGKNIDSKRPRPDDSVVATSGASSEKREWGSKQPKPVDVDILKYALTTGGEIARRTNELKTLETRLAKDEIPDESIQKRIEEDAEALAQLRTALFAEVEEGEASLACDKRGSRVLQALIREGESSAALGVFDRIKPYLGHLVYDSFASHVIQALLNRFSAEESTKSERKYVSGLCQAVSKANEWWAMMHDKSATYVARTCAQSLERIGDLEGLEALFQSLLKAPQSDFRAAARNPQAAPFLPIAIGCMESENKREVLVSRLFSDERNGSAFDRKMFDSCVQDRLASRVMDQCVARCSVSFVEDVLFSRGLEAPFLVRSAKHPFANFVVQRVLERLSTQKCLERALTELPVGELIDFDRVGVLTSLAKELGPNEKLASKYVAQLVEAKVVERCLQHLEPVKDEEEPLTVEKQEQKEGKSEGPAYRPVKVHLGLAELLNQVFSAFPASVLAPLCEIVMGLEVKTLLSLACDPVGGKKVVEAILDRGAEMGRPLATRFISNYARLVMNAFGVHCARKAFVLLSAKDKVNVMEREIVPSKSKFAGSILANKFATQVQLGKFVTNKKEWLKAMEETGPAKEGVKKKKDLIQDEWTKELGL